MHPSRRRRDCRAGGSPTIDIGIVSAAAIRIAGGIISPPDNHFTAGPHCRVTTSASRCVYSAGSYPVVRARTVSSAGVEIVITAPDDHFTASPDCRVTDSGSGRGGSAGGYPTVGDRVVSPARS